MLIQQEESSSYESVEDQPVSQSVDRVWIVKDGIEEQIS